MLFPRRFPIIVLTISCLIALLAFPSAARALGPKGDAYVGYSHLGNNSFYPNTGGLNGWEGALHLKVKPFVGIEGDVAQYGLGASAAIPRTTTFMAGPRVTVGAMGIKLFAHGLAGGQHSGNSSGISISSSTFTYAVGGGMDVRIAPFFSWRVSGDYLRAPTLSSGSGTHARIGTGLVFRF